MPGLGQRRVWKEQHKLIARVPANDILLAHCVAQQTGHRAKDIVALQVPEGVVDGLEVIDVNDGERDRLAAGGRIVEHLSCLREKSFAQHEACQIVERCNSVGDACILPARRSGIHRAWRRRARDVFEQAEERRIELSTHIVAHDLDRLIVRQRCLVAAVRCERVIHIRQTHNARPQRNPFSAQRVRVASAIPVFMMVAHNCIHIVREIDLPENVCAGAGMQLHHIPFVRRESFSLVEDFRRDHDLTDIVQERTDAEPEERILFDAGAAREGACEIGDAFAMSLRVRVFLFDRLAPFMHDVEHIALETPDQCGHRGHRLIRPQLREQLMRTVQ